MSDAFVSVVERAMSEQKVSVLMRLRIRMRLALPALRREIESAVSEELAFAGVVGAAGLIDWENFDPEKFAALVEAIIKIIQMFMGM